MGLETKEEFSAGADTIYTHGQEGRTQVERGKGKKQNVKFIIFWHLFFLFSFASQFDPVFFLSGETSLFIDEEIAILFFLV
jgi:hypothetical protein